jgi:hypothetical protein
MMVSEEVVPNELACIREDGLSTTPRPGKGPATDCLRR